MIYRRWLLSDGRKAGRLSTEKRDTILMFGDQFNLRILAPVMASELTLRAQF